MKMGKVKKGKLFLITTFIFAATVGNLSVSAEQGKNKIGITPTNDPSIRDYFRGARPLNFPETERTKIFRPEKNKANFTFFHGVRDIAVKNGKLVFTMSGNEAVLGWGNYMGKQPAKEVLSLYPEINKVFLRLKGSADSSWRMKYWCDGKLIATKRSRQRASFVKLDKDEWKDLEFKQPCMALPKPDGMGFTIKAPAGTRFELEWVKAVQPMYEGYVRTEFTIPAGKIWKAYANAGNGNNRIWFKTNRINSEFYINGQLVKRPVPEMLYCAYPVDIKKYLRAGKNCAAFHGSRVGYPPFIMLNATVIMESGEVIRISTGPGWKYSPEAGKGWNTVNFNAAKWTVMNNFGGNNIWPGHQKTPPGYLGLIHIINPDKKDLFYTDNQNVRMNIAIPPGLTDKSPSIEWILEKCDKSGHGKVVEKGTLGSFTNQNGSLLYQMNLGKRTDGVYTIAMKLVAKDGKVIDARPREPLVVLKKTAFRKIEADDYRQGLELEKEDIIDFTNPEDPHPWIEAEFKLSSLPTIAVKKAKIVKRNGLEYREVTGPKRSSYFSYRFEFRHPGDFYLFELDYPDDANRCVEAVIDSNKERVWTNSQAGVGAETGGKFYKSGKMKTLRWIQVADSGPQSVTIINVQDEWNAAAKELRIFRIKNKTLPSAGSGLLRDYGIHTERCHQTSGIGMNFGVDYPKTTEYQREKSRLPVIQQNIIDLVWMKETCEKYMQYLKFSGQNMHLMGCIQYYEYNTPFIPRLPVDTARIPVCIRTMLANVLDVNNISFLCGIEYSSPCDARTTCNNAQVAQGVPTMWMVDKNGKQYYCIDECYAVCNYLTPEYREGYYRVVDNIINTFGDLKHFSGISNFFGPTQKTNYYMPAFGFMNEWDNPLAYSFDDLTFREFAKDTGFKLPIAPDDPQRFRKRADIMKSSRIRKKFLDWRAKKVTEFYDNLATYINRKRSDLKFVNLLAVEEQACFKQMLKSGKTFAEMMKEFAIDIEALGKIKNMVVMRWTVSWRFNQRINELESQQPYTWVARENEKVISAFENLPRRGVLCRTSWDENKKMAAGHKFSYSGHAKLIPGCDWIFDAIRTRALPQPGGYNVREALIQAIITADPEIILTGFTDLNINVGHEQELREIMRIYTNLPHDNFETVLDTNLKTNLVIRKLSKGNESWLYIANPGYWFIDGRIELAGGAITTIPDKKLVSGEGRVSLPVKLAPFGLAAFKVDSGKLTVKSYTTGSISEKELSHMTNIIDRVKSLVNDKIVRLALPVNDRKYMKGILSKAEKAVMEKKYALAWSLLKRSKFWILWQDFLEKGAVGMSKLPESVKMESAPAAPDKIRALRAKKAGTPIKADGKLLESDWKKVQFSGNFRECKTGKPALNETAVKALYDNDNIYLAVVCADRNPDKVKASANTESSLFSCKDDIIAIMIQPDENIPVYYQMAFNAKGTQFDQQVKGGERNYAFHPDWKCKSSKGQGIWTAEVVFPCKSFGVENGRGKGKWRINVFRVMRNKILPASSWTLPAKSGDWHDPAKFGKLEFKN